MRENADLNNSECGHFLRSVKNKDKSLKQIYYRKKKLYQQLYESLQCQVVHDTRLTIAGLTTSFSSEDAFPSVSLPAEKLKPFINDSDSKQNKSNVDVTG